MGDFMSKLFGGDSFLGSDAFKNMAGLGTNVWQGMQMGDMMNFQKDMANQSMGMQQQAFDANMEDRDKAANLDWTAGYVDPNKSDQVWS